jgi:hypothetical protein
MSKRVYKFLKPEDGIDDLKNRRLKVSTLDGLNDPFDLFSVDTTDPNIAFAVTAMVAEFKRGMKNVPELKHGMGLTSFSRNWDNLLLWSHYASGHTGLCLGFDISENSNKWLDVQYQPNLQRIRGPQDLNRNFALKMFTTKHESWSYEQEVRLFVGLEDPPDDNKRFWFPFGPNLQLREVIIGVQCRTDVADEVCKILGEWPDEIDCTWAYMRSDAFLLVRSKMTHANVFRPSERTLTLPLDTLGILG